MLCKARVNDVTHTLVGPQKAGSSALYPPASLSDAPHM
jgi:hypothetical protein